MNLKEKTEKNTNKKRNKITMKNLKKQAKRNNSNSPCSYYNSTINLALNC